MEVVLVNPPRYKGIYVIREDRCEITERENLFPPYSLAQIAAVLREQGYGVTLIDANGLNLDLNDVRRLLDNISYDACIFRFTPTTLQDDLSVAGFVKNANKSAVTIGICWTLKSFAAEVLRETDSLDIYAIDEPLVTIPLALNALEHNEGLKEAKGLAFNENDRIVLTDPFKDKFDFDAVPMPAYDLLPPLDTYFLRGVRSTPFTTIQTSKGCPFRCTYCPVSGTRWNPRSADTVLEEIRHVRSVYNVRTVMFFDETFTLDRGRAVDICQGMIDDDLDIAWYCNTRADRIDFELLKLMKRAGCQGLSLGVESGSQEILTNARKGTTIEQNEKAIAAAKAARIKTYCSFMFGLPGEDRSTAQETIDFVKRTLPNGAQFNVVVPYPGTPLFNMAVEKKWIGKDVDWARLYQHVSTMRTDELSTEELEHTRKKAYRALYFNPRWIITNVNWVLKEPKDLSIAVGYFMHSLKNYVLHGMEHAH
jgi:radical SAM superfamily enzyme YgiQ (UPF0313 family)